MALSARTTAIVMISAAVLVNVAFTGLGMVFDYPTYHQQQWLLGIQQLQEDGFTDGVIENSNGEWEDKAAAHVFYTSTPGSRAGEGLWATSNSMVDGEPFRVEPLEPPTDDTGILPPPDPKQFVTYDGSQGPAKPGDARGAYAQGAQNVVGKIKDALTPDS